MNVTMLNKYANIIIEVQKSRKKFASLYLRDDGSLFQ